MRFKNKCVLVLCLVLLVTLFSACNSGYVPYNYDLDKYIRLGEYKEISYQFVNIGVSDADVQQAVWQDMRENGYGQSSEIHSGEVLLGDIVTIDFTGSIDGEDVPALAATGLKLEIGSETFLDGFESGLIGQDIGEKCNLQVTFPKDYIKVAYAGKTADYEVTIHSAERVECPELTDAIVADISDDSTVDEYTAAVRSELEKQAVAEADADIEQEVWDKIVDAAQVIEYPKKAIEYLSDQTRKEFENTAAEKDQTLDEYLQSNDLTTEEFEQYVLARAQSVCKEEMVMHAIARKESIEVSAKEVKQLAQTYADTYDYKSIKELYKNYSQELVEQTLLYQKVKDFVVENAKEIG